MIIVHVHGDILIVDDDQEEREDTTCRDYFEVVVLRAHMVPWTSPDGRSGRNPDPAHGLPGQMFQAQDSDEGFMIHTPAGWKVTDRSRFRRVYPQDI